MKSIKNTSNQSDFYLQKILPKKSIPESTRESLMSMMKEIMEKNYFHSDQLHNILEESVQQSIIQKENDTKQYHSINQDQNLCFNESYSVKKNQPFSTICNIGSNSDSQYQTCVPLASSEFCKLLEITQRCVNYYNNFFQQKSSQLQIIEKTFNDLNSNLNLAFEEMISELVKKQKEIKEFLLKKYEEIVTFRENQDFCLKETLNQVKKFHLINQKSSELSVELHNYASTLNQFYSMMEEIQKSNFKQMVEESVNFINNLVTEEIRVTLYEKIPSRLSEKRMIRENSKDFLLESRDNSIEIRSDTFGILDVQSFTKLFFDTDQKPENLKDQKFSHQKEEFFKNIDKGQSNLNFHMEKKNIIPLIEPNPEDKKLNSIQKKSLASSKDFNIKSNHQNSFSPLKKNSMSCKNNQNQNELELIKKISNQQSNRSAKIKGYLVTFQDQKLPSKEVPQQKPQTSRPFNHSKSSSKLSNTPVKLNKSSEKKQLSSSVQINQSNEQKLKNCSLKTSRNSGTVSEFKLTSNRRQSLANNK